MFRRPVTLIWAIPLICGAALVVWAIAVPLLPWKVAYWWELRQGDQIIANIADFQRQQHRLPNPEKRDEMLSLGFAVRVDYYPAFRNVDANNYELAYDYGFEGEQIIYSSATRQWTCDMC